MDVVIKGFKPRGIVNVPCSKSEAHRVLIMAFLLKRKLTIKNISYSDDINATIEAIEAMGAKVAKNKDSLANSNNTIPMIIIMSIVSTIIVTLQIISIFDTPISQNIEKSKIK